MTADRDQALIEEAVRQAQPVVMYDLMDGSLARICRKLLELERSGWQPTDPDVLAVREIASRAHGWRNGDEGDPWVEGSQDTSTDFQAALAAYRKHKGGAHG